MQRLGIDRRGVVIAKRSAIKAVVLGTDGLSKKKKLIDHDHGEIFKTACIWKAIGPYGGP